MPGSPVTIDGCLDRTGTESMLIPGFFAKRYRSPLDERLVDSRSSECLGFECQVGQQCHLGLQRNLGQQHSGYGRSSYPCNPW